MEKMEIEQGTMNIREHEGWIGAFTRDQARQAQLKNGQRVCKSLHELGDATPVGTGGVVLGSVFHWTVGVGYFVEWDDKPRIAVLVVAAKVRAAL